MCSTNPTRLSRSKLAMFRLTRPKEIFFDCFRPKSARFRPTRPFLLSMFRLFRLNWLDCLIQACYFFYRLGFLSTNWGKGNKYFTAFDSSVLCCDRFNPNFLPDCKRLTGPQKNYTRLYLTQACYNTTGSTKKRYLIAFDTIELILNQFNSKWPCFDQKIH